MSLRKLLILGLFLLPVVALAAPTTNYFFHIAPTVTDTYNNGTSVLRWLNFFTKFASTTQLTVSGQTSGCAQFDSTGFITSIGTNCGSGSGSFPFTPTSYGNSTTSVIGFLNGLISNGSTTIPSVGSGLVGANNGLLYGFASSSLFGFTPANSATTLTINGTASQVSVSGGTQDLSANRTWTASLPNHVIFPGNFQVFNSTTTNATTTSFAALGSSTIQTLNLSNPLAVSSGGTGAATLTGCLTGNGTGAITGLGTCNTSAASVTSIATTYPIQGGTITTSGTLTFGGLATTSPWTGSGVAWRVNDNTISTAATGTISGSGGIGVTAGQSVIGSGLTISCASCALFGYDWTPATNYAVNTNSTTTPIWLKQGVMASSTSHFDKLDIGSTTNSTMSTSTVYGNLIINGLVGIGTSTVPTGVNANAKLTVSGMGSQDIIASTTDNSTLSDAVIEAYAPGARTFMGAHGTSQVTSRYGITLGGWSEIGAFNSTFGSSNGLIIGTNPAVPLVFGTNNVERMRILSTGNVGVGSTSPIQRFSVGGGNITLDQFNSYMLNNVIVLAATSTTWNTEVGLLAGKSLVSTSTDRTSGLRNTALGYIALQYATSSDDNIAIGYEALEGSSLPSDFSGSRNIAVGNYSLASSTTGGTNTALGYKTLMVNTTGGGNSAFGDSALIANTTGSNNMAVGVNSLGANTTGFSNVAVGFATQGQVTTANGNTAIGHDAMATGNGSYNTTIGSEAGNGLSTGYSNILIGSSPQANDNLTSGARNIGIGIDVHFPSASTDGQLNIGNLIFGSLPATSTSLITPVTGTVGIATTTPWGMLSVSNTTANPSFVVEDSASPDTSPFIIDAAGLVGIGTSTPGVGVDAWGTSFRQRIATPNGAGGGSINGLEIISSRPDGNSTFESRIGLGFRNDSGTGIVSPQALGSIMFGGQYDTGTNIVAANQLYPASIKGVAEGTFSSASAMPTGLTFSTGLVGDSLYSANLTYGTERMRIASDGDIGVASSSPFGRFSVDTTTLVSGEPEFVVGSSTRTDIMTNQNGFTAFGSTTANYKVDITQTGATGLLPAMNLSEVDSTHRRATMGFGLNAGATTGWVFGQGSGDNTVKDFYWFDATNNVFPMYISATDNVGVATSSPWRTFSVVGTVAFNGLTVSTAGNAVCISTKKDIEDAGAGACVVSSAKAKHDITTIPASLAQEVMKLNPVSYTYNDTEEQRYGLIAEEVAKIDPKLVEYAQEDLYVTGQDGKPVLIKKGDPYTVDYQRYTGVLTAFVQDLQKQIDSLKGGIITVKESAQDKWQDIAIGVLFLIVGLQAMQIRRIRKE